MHSTKHSQLIWHFMCFKFMSNSCRKHTQRIQSLGHVAYAFVNSIQFFIQIAKNILAHLQYI